MSDKDVKRTAAKPASATKPVAAKTVVPADKQVKTVPAAVAAVPVKPVPVKPVVVETKPVETPVAIERKQVKTAPAAIAAAPMKPAAIVTKPATVLAVAEEKQVKTVPAAIAAAPVEPAIAKAAPAPVPPVAEKKQAPTAPAAAVVEAAIETKPAIAPVTPITKGSIMTDTVNTAQTFAQDAQNRATALFNEFNTRTKAAVERSTKLVEELSDFNKGNIEALVESGRVAAKAAETLGQQAAETARKNFEQTTAVLKSFASAKTPTEFFQLQSDYARNAFDALIAETSKNSETLLKVAGDVFQPISNRFAVAAEKIKTAA